MEDALCRACGRPIQRQARGESGTPPRYCSRRCRNERISPLDRRIEERILSLLAERGPQHSICPSEVAREAVPDGWRDQMERVRRAGRRLAAGQRLEFTQRGRVVDPSTVRGPVRFRLPRS